MYKKIYNYIIYTVKNGGKKNKKPKPEYFLQDKAKETTHFKF